MTKQAEAIIERSMWVKWVAANALGLVAGQIGGVSTGFVIGGLIAQSAGLEIGTIVARAITGGMTGAFLGVTQRIFLQRELELDRRWVWYSIAGWAIAYVAATSFASALYTVVGPGLSTGVFWALIGISVGVAQWRALLDRIPRALLWIPANIAGWLAGPLVASALLVAFFAAQVSAEGAPVADLASAAITGLVAGMITGFALIRLLRESPQPA
jgi:hypothetical protein